MPSPDYEAHEVAQAREWGRRGAAVKMKEAASAAAPECLDSGLPHRLADLGHDLANLKLKAVRAMLSAWLKQLEDAGLLQEELYGWVLAAGAESHAAADCVYKRPHATPPLPSYCSLGLLCTSLLWLLHRYFYASA